MAIVYTIEWMDKAKTKTGKDVINATLKSQDGIIHEKVSIWGNFPSWNDLRPGSSVSGDIITNDKGYKSLKEETTKGFIQSGYKAPSGAVKAAEITRESVKEAQGKKNESIAYFNSLNAAIALYGHVPAENKFELGVEEFLVKWRNFFLSEWQKYEAQDPNDKHKPF